MNESGKNWNIIFKMSNSDQSHFLFTYLLYGSRADELEGNAQYEGFCIDIIDELSQIYGFKYIIIKQENNTVGALVNNATKEWS